MSNIISELKGKVSILDLCIQLGIKLSANNMAKCPFGSHVDKTASFKVYPNSNSFYCFGCGKGGDIITLERLFYNLTSNLEAAIKIAERNNITFLKNKLTSKEKRKIKTEKFKQNKILRNINSFNYLKKEQYDKLFNRFKTLSQLSKIPKKPYEKGSELYAFAKSELNNLTDYHKNGESWSRIEEYLEILRCGTDFEILKEYNNTDFFIKDLENRWNKMMEGISNNEL